MITEETGGTLKALKEVLPPNEKEPFLAWINRGKKEGWLNEDEHSNLTRLFVYEGNNLEALVSAI